MQAIVFDLDNTLYPYTPCDLAGRNAVYAYVNPLCPMPYGDFANLYVTCDLFTKASHPKTAAGHNRLLFYHHMCELLSLPADVHDLLMYDAYWNAYLNAMQLFPGVIELLQNLKAKKILLGICSDLTLHIQLRKLQKLGLLGVFDKIVVSEECGEEKPSPKMFNDILAKLGVSAAESVMIGDNYKRDIVGALNVGMRAILFGEEHEGVECVQNFAALKTML